MLHHILEVENGRELWKDDEFDYLMKQVFLYLYRLQSDQETTILSTDQMRIIREVIDYIRSESIGQNDIQKLYEIVHVSPGYLNLLFKRYTGLTLKKYVTRERLQRAQHLLSDPLLNVSKVSEMIGYSDVYTFSKIFKKYFGEAPSQYRNRIHKMIRQ